jgi:hypothetical protein
LGELVADQSFWAVACIWALTWLSWAIYVDRYSNSMPWADEYGFVSSGIATGEHPLTWDFLWTPANEHRAPLTRLWVVGLGRCCNWDFRHMLQVDLAVLALGCLTLVLGARAARARSSFCDAFLPLLILSSGQHSTIAQYVYAYSMALAVWCATASAVMVKWQLRSTPHLLLYLSGAMVVTWAGGPPGNLWALGLCAPLALGWFERSGRSWKVCAVVGGAAVAASSALLIYCVPPSPAYHLAFRSDSWGMAFRVAAKFSVGWMGGPVLQVIWPWALLALVVPLLYLLVRFLVDVRRFRAAALARWLDLAALLAPALALTVVMGHARGKYLDLWSSRYVALEIPIAVTLFLLLVRHAAPTALMTGLAVGMAICVGWNWQSVIDVGRSLRSRQMLLTNGLREGHEPLSVLAEPDPEATGWNKEIGVQCLLVWWQQMRRARISVFAKGSDSARQCLFWHSETGSLGGALHLVPDPRAAAGQAVQAETDAPEATAVYEATVPANGVYKLCCRWMVPQPGRSFAVAIDGAPVATQPVPGGPDYAACVLERTVPLDGGTHRIAITWPGAGSRLDVLELTPQ